MTNAVHCEAIEPDEKSE